MSRWTRRDADDCVMENNVSRWTRRGADDCVIDNNT